MKTRSFTIRKQLNFILKNNKLILFFAIGCICSFLVFKPVIGVAGITKASMSFSFLRIFRVASVLLLFPLLGIKFLRLVRDEAALSILVFLTFCFLPFVAYFSFPFWVASAKVGPFIVSGISLFLLCSLTKRQFVAWILGLGFMSFLFLLSGLFKYGFQVNEYWGEPAGKILMGFITPVDTASAICCSFLFLFLTSTSLNTKNKMFRIGFFCLIFISFLMMLYLPKSQKTLLAISVLLGWTLIGKYLRIPIFRFIVMCLWCLIPWTVYIAAYLIPVDEKLWNLINEVSSGRLILYKREMAQLIDTDFSNLLYGKIFAYQQQMAFASSHSVFLTIIDNFGLMTLGLFILFFIYMGFKIVKNKCPAHVFAIWMMLVLYYTSDPQGLTPSNIWAFVLLGYVFRWAMKNPVTHLNIFQLNQDKRYNKEKTVENSSYNQNALTPEKI